MFESLRAPLDKDSERPNFAPTWLIRIRQSIGRNRSRTFAYEHQEATMSLRDGLDEYYASDPNLLAPAPCGGSCG